MGAANGEGATNVRAVKVDVDRGVLWVSGTAVVEVARGKCSRRRRPRSRGSSR